MTIDLSEEIDPALWATLPDDDRVFVGGRTVWTGPFREPLVVAQPNRWGVIEEGFPDVACVVEVDAPVSGHLSMPARTVGFVDRAHRSVPPPERQPLGARLIAGAQTLSKAITQIRGVTVAAMPFARTIPLMTPREPADVIAECHRAGLVGIRRLPGLAGGVALTVTERLGPDDFGRIADVLAGVVGRER